MRNKLFLVVIAVVFLLGGLTIYWWYRGEPEQATVSSNEYFLLMGLDQFGEVRRTDTIMLAKLEGQGVKLLSIPRDLQVKLPDGKFAKINAAYGVGGPELTGRLVSEFLGLPVQAYIVADFQAVKEIVNVVGGVDINIPKPMNYQDTKQGLQIQLAAGPQTLNGAKAVEYLRYRDTSTREDLGRIQRQQQFISLLAKKLSQVSDPGQIKNVAGTALKYIQTNLSTIDLYRFVDRVRSFTEGHLRFATIPGESKMINDESFYLSYPLETAALVEEFFNGKEILTNGDIKVIVLNGFPDATKRGGLAKRAFDFVKAQGFSGVAYWNAEAYDYQTSYIISLNGDMGKAQRLASTLKDSSIQIISADDYAALPLASDVTYREENRLKEIGRMLLTTAVAPDSKAVDLNTVDLVLIVGGSYSVTQAGL